MEDRSAILEASDRREPRWLTLADMLMLIIGFALAFSLPRLHHLDDPLMSLGAVIIPMPGWSAELLVLREAAMKAGLVVVPVILARRVRYGGLPRPADWLAILVVLLWLRDALVQTQGIKRFARWFLVDLRSWLGSSIEVLPHGTLQVGKTVYAGYEGFPVGFSPMDEYRLWYGCAVVVFLSLLTALGIGGRRMPAWFKSVFLSVAAFAGLEGWNHFSTIYLLQRWYAISQQLGLPMDVAHQIAIGLNNFPERLLFGVFAVAALLDLRKGGHKRWVWTGWLGLAATLVVLAAGVGIDVSDLTFQVNRVACRQFAMQFAHWFVVGLAGWIIVKRVGRSGHPFLGP